eukprot:g16036.t1
MLGTDSLAAAVRLYNMESVWCTPWQFAVLQAAAMRNVLCPAGSITAVQLPAATTTTTALIPWSSGPAPTFNHFVVFSPAPSPALAAIATFGPKTIGVYMGPGNTDEDEAETVALTRQMVAVLSLHQQRHEEPAALGNSRSASKALVPYDHSSGKSKAAVAPFLRTFSCCLPLGVNSRRLPPTGLGGKNTTLDGDMSSGTRLLMWSCILRRRFLEGGPSEVGGGCGFIPGGKSSSWSSSIELAGEEAMTVGGGTTQQQEEEEQQQQEREQSEQGGGHVEDELGAALEVMDEEDATAKVTSMGMSTTPPFTPSSASSSPIASNSTELSKETMNSFFEGSSYHGGGTGGTDSSSSEEGMESSRNQRHMVGAVQHDPILAPLFHTETKAMMTLKDDDDQAVPESTSPSKKVELGRVHTSGAGQSVAGATKEGAADEVDEVEASKALPEAEQFDTIVKGLKPGQLRSLLISNLRDREVGSAWHTCAELRMAEFSFGVSGNNAGVLDEGMVLGEGSFGVVKVARNSVLPGEYALKMLKTGAGYEARYCAAVEMITLARLAKAPHDNLIGAVSIDDRAGHIGSMMPVLLPKARMDFVTAIEGDSLSMSAKLRCLQQIASGLDHLHGLGIGHGDVKPANVLLFSDEDGCCLPKLCDFGMTRAMREKRPGMMGTPGFMPLEVMRGEVITHPSQDVFAMGVMALLVCMSPDKAQANPFVSPALQTQKEARRKKVFDAEGEGDDCGCPLHAAMKQRFELRMTERVLFDGSFVKLMTADNLHPDLGSSAKLQVPLNLLPFMHKEPESRRSMTEYETAMEKLATAVEVEEAATKEEGCWPGPGLEGVQESDEDDVIGMDIDRDDEDCEDNELF